MKMKTTTLVEEGTDIVTKKMMTIIMNGGGT